MVGLLEQMQIPHILGCKRTYVLISLFGYAHSHKWMKSHDVNFIMRQVLRSNNAYFPLKGGY
jgi:hypothetical protein